MISPIHHSIHISVCFPACYPKFTHSIHISVSLSSSLFYPKFTTQFIPWCPLLQLVWSQIHHSIHILVFSPTVRVITNSPLNSSLGVFSSSLFDHKFTTQIIPRCPLLQLVLSQIHHSIHASVSSSPACLITNSPLKSFLGVLSSSLFYHKFTTQFMPRCPLLQLVWSQIHHSIHPLVSSPPACLITNSPLNSSLGVLYSS